jgi:hypothetical protein
MNLGLGLYRRQLNEEHYRFGRQCGRTHLVIHLADYFRSSRSNRPGDQSAHSDSELVILRAAEEAFFAWLAVKF